MQKNKSILFITETAMMIALSVIIGIFCKNFLNFGAGLFRITFENIPIIMAGVIMGPVAGCAVGLSSDLLSYFLSAQAYPPNYIVTVGAVTVGLVSGLVSKFLIKRRGSVQIIVSGALAHISGSLIIKSIGLFQFYQYGVFLRIPLYLIIAPIEIGLICALLKKKSFARAVGYVGIMKKEEAIEYIHSVSWTFCKPGLERTEELTKRLGNPQNSLKFIHVAGTNGKGSFCSMLSSILAKQGYLVGLYTSPYIRVFNERMQINGVPISDTELSEITEKIKPIAEQMEDKPTEFELVTAIALEYFSRHKCEYVVLECGLGGRLDSTNIITTPELTVITGIDFDHTSILGNTIGEIAKEKAGIIKDGVPCLWCGDCQEAYDVIKSVAEEKGSALYTVERDSVNVKNATLEGTFFDFNGFDDVEISLIGEYQVTNACNVIRAVEILKEKGIAIEDKSVYEGLKEARWPARFEVLNKDPLVIFDGAHNPQGVSSCVESIKKYFKDQRVVVVTGVMADKDYRFIADKIGEVALRVMCVTPENPRALKAEEYAKEFTRQNIEADGFDTVFEAVNMAKKVATDKNTAVACLGSLYMYSQIEKALEG